MSPKQAADTAVKKHAVGYSAPEPGPSGKGWINVDRIIVAREPCKPVEFVLGINLLNT